MSDRKVDLPESRELSLEDLETRRQRILDVILPILRKTGFIIPENTSWGEIDDLIPRIFMDQAQAESDKPHDFKVTKMLGAIPPDDLNAVYDKIGRLLGFASYDELTECIRQGIERERIGGVIWYPNTTSE